MEQLPDASVPAAVTPQRSRRAMFGAMAATVAGLATAGGLRPTRVAATGEWGDYGALFYPVSPTRVFDSRLAVYANSGLLLPMSSRTVSVKHGFDDAGNLIDDHLVPWDAKAVAITLTVAGPTGPNYLTVTPGPATSFRGTTINFPGGFDLSTGTLVKIKDDLAIKVWSGDQSGSTHVIADVTGFFK